MKNLAVKHGGRILKAIANEKRLEILYALVGRELNVTELCKLIGLSQSSLSQHLAILREEKIVKTRREAQTIYYTVSSENVLKILNLLDKIYNNPYKS